ncbi:MAG TPA: hypothetical protein PLU72_09440 [Candidatus Ozemobacteraceae bacterium]|nr:hypothetical protein [Candidatus Ozemobacteraceae bacterium]
MKLEIRVNETPGNARDDEVSSVAAESAGALQTIQAGGQDIAIDIAQVLAANQALLTNIARKMEAMETRMRGLESVIESQKQAMLAYTQEVALLAAPVARLDVWKPAAPQLDEAWFGKFSMFDRIFRPYRMRRPSAEEH